LHGVGQRVYFQTISTRGIFRGIFNVVYTEYMVKSRNKSPVDSVITEAYEHIVQVYHSNTVTFRFDVRRGGISNALKKSQYSRRQICSSLLVFSFLYLIAFQKSPALSWEQGWPRPPQRVPAHIYSSDYMTCKCPTRVKPNNDCTSNTGKFSVVPVQHHDRWDDLPCRPEHLVNRAATLSRDARGTFPSER
jgi:hypothetical protein